jgi:hypothetical protein
VVLEIIPGSMNMPSGQSTHSFLNKFEIFFLFCICTKDSAKIRGRGCNTLGFEPPFLNNVLSQC